MGGCLGRSKAASLLITLNDEEEREDNPNDILDEDKNEVDATNGTAFHTAIANITSLIDTTFGMVRFNQENTVDLAKNQGVANEIIGRVGEGVTLSKLFNTYAHQF